MTDDTDGTEEQSKLTDKSYGPPPGARHHVSNETVQDAVARPGGAAQNSGGAIAGNSETDAGAPWKEDEPSAE